MELIGSQGTKNRALRVPESTREDFPEAREVQTAPDVRCGEKAAAPADAEFFRSPFDFRRQEFQIRRCLDPARRREGAFPSEKTESTKIECHELFGAHNRPVRLECRRDFLADFADEFQRYVQVFRTHPASFVVTPREET